MQASNGKLYEMTTWGGAFGYGVLFEYDISSNTFTKKLDFNGKNNGSHPVSTALIETTVPSNIFDNILNNKDIKIYPNPTNDFLNVECKSYFVMEIYDIFGKKILTSEKSYTDILKIAKGIYIIQIKNKKGIPLKIDKLIIK